MAFEWYQSKKKGGIESSLDEAYPEYAKALKHAEIATSIFPQLKEVISKINTKKVTKEKKKKRKRRKIQRGIRMYDTWKDKNAIHLTLKTLKKKHNLKLLCLSMFYDKWSNLREILQGYLTSKILKEIDSYNFKDLPCNYNAASKADNKCIYNSKCRSSIYVYKATYWQYATKHKKRMNNFFSEVRSLVSNNLTSDRYLRKKLCHPLHKRWEN